MKTICITLTALTLGIASIGAAKGADPPSPLNEADRKLEANYAGMLEQLRTELTGKLPDAAKTDQANAFLASDALDAKLAKYVVLLDATPEGLAMFAQKGQEQAALVERMLADADLMKRMLVADGAGGGKYGRAMEIYTAILKARFWRDDPPQQGMVIKSFTVELAR